MDTQTSRTAICRQRGHTHTPHNIPGSSKTSAQGDELGARGKARQAGTSRASDTVPQSLNKQSKSSGINRGQPQSCTHQTSFQWWGRSKVKPGSQDKARSVSSRHTARYRHSAAQAGNGAEMQLLSKWGKAPTSLLTAFFHTNLTQGCTAGPYQSWPWPQPGEGEEAADPAAMLSTWHAHMASPWLHSPLTFPPAPTSSLQLCFSNNLFSVLHRLSVWKFIKQDSFSICVAYPSADVLKAVWLVQQIRMWVYQLHWRDCIEGFLSIHLKLAICFC